MAGDEQFLEALTEARLYSIGAFFCDRHPDLVDDVLAQSVEIEHAGLAGWAAGHDVSAESAFQTLVTGLAVRYYTAVAGGDGRGAGS